MSHDQKDGRRADLKGGQARERQWGGKGLSAQRGRARSRAHMDQGTGARKQHGARGGDAGPCISCSLMSPSAAPCSRGREAGP